MYYSIRSIGEMRQMGKINMNLFQFYTFEFEIQIKVIVGVNAVIRGNHLSYR